MGSRELSRWVSCWTSTTIGTLFCDASGPHRPYRARSKMAGCTCQITKGWTRGRTMSRAWDTHLASVKAGRCPA